MNLRLRIATAPDSSTTFEHPGPVVRIGRDTDCELALEGEAGRTASRYHARIELAPGRALLSDLGSSNGTLLNDRVIDRPEPLRVGDRIQLGYTGTTLTVLELDLTATAPAPAAAGLGLGAVLLGLGAVGVCVVLLGLALGLYMARSGRGQPSPSKPLVIVQNPPPTQPDKSTVPDKPPVKPPAKPLPLPEEVGKDAPSAAVREVGRYVALPQWGPSVLLQRAGEAQPWTPLRPESKVATAQTLVSLPGYRSVIALDSGVHLTLWGNLPEFSGFPPLLESVAMLNVPTAGEDLDLTLERGRIHLANRKRSGPAHVRLRFLREVWDLVLPDGNTEVCAELWAQPPQATTGADRPPVLCLGLFTKGRARLQTPGRQLDLADRTRLSWVSPPGKLLDPVVLPQLPDWWAKLPDPANPQVADAMLTLLDWSGELARSKEVLDTILTRVQEPKDPTQRLVGLLFLAALDGAPYVVDFLEDRQHAEVRGTAAHALRCRLARGADQPADLVRLLQQRRGYGKEKAALIVQLLQRIPEDALVRPETYQGLIAHLDHENLAVRDLAHWHLVLLVPEGGQKIAYDPAGDPAQRQRAIEQWKKLLPPGKVPARRT